MNSRISLDHVAGLIGEPARAAMLTALLAGRALTAGELSMIAGVSAQNASGHLQKLLNAKLISIEVQGRHRYYRLSSVDVAHALESLAVISSSRDFPTQETRQLSELRFCRTCYDHLAGIVAAEIASGLLERGMIREEGRNFSVTASGTSFFARLGIDLAPLSAQRRALARRCLDWTERRPHISGSLGNAMLLRFQKLKWIVPVRGSRVVRVTAGGQREIPRHFGLKAFPRLPNTLT
jgi:DNA-binding transcriptional ArsR family regulator